jgi:hypothetical protein
MGEFNKNRKIGFLPTGNHIKLHIVVIFHHAVVLMNIAAFAVLAFTTPWYIACPLMTWIAMLSSSRVLDCPLTKYENKLRRGLGKPEIRGFIKHYLIKPYMRGKIRVKKL